MNRPDSLPIDVEELRAWAVAERESHGFSWSRFASLTGVPAGTLSPFCAGKYPGDKDAIARKIYRYRQTSENRRDLELRVPERPDFVETATAGTMIALLKRASLGMIVVAATGPGTGKTTTINHFAACNSYVWVATMRKSTRSLNAMAWEVAKAVGITIRYQWSAGASRDIADHVRNKRGLIVIDEANHLDTDAIEEIRAWNDLTGVGVALFGNEELLRRIRSKRNLDTFGRLSSRIAASVLQDIPQQQDIDAYLDAWRIDDAAIRKALSIIALGPNNGGLRAIAMTLEFALMLAAEEGRPLALSHVRDAHDGRSVERVQRVG